MVCKYKTSSLEKCYGCGRTKKVYKCKKTNMVVTNNTCRFCKYNTMKEEQKRGKEYDNLQSFSDNSWKDK